MMLKFLMAVSISCFTLTSAYARQHGFIGFNKALKTTQNSKGKIEEKPFSPTLGYGYNFNLFDSGFGFSPQIGYVHTKQITNDSYGKQKVHSVFLNWDFIWLSPLSDSLAFRFGIGNFIKRTSGEGGTVEIPNGTGTAQARRPSKTVNSYSSTFNIGADYNFDIQLFDAWIKDVGLRFELYTFRPLSKNNRNYMFNIGAIFFF